MNQILIPTKKIPPSGLDIHWRKSGAELDLKGEFTTLQPVEINGLIKHLGSIYLFTGSIKTKFELKCARCLERFPLAVETDFMINYESEICQPSHDHKEMLEIELGKDDLDISYFKDELLPVGEDLREAILVALPAAPHCSESCKGLCPECGVNQNHSTCECQKEDIDQRWESLAALKKNLEEK